ncbi:4-diphosphocytidyl-2-C-methyl-D-erythritol kinase [Spirochaetota bacterium]|nr:4-diphosphocytidyl-2-C-methyl-D-erythritol kinase [Spirochaetota bacterium]
MVGRVISAYKENPITLLAYGKINLHLSVFERNLGDRLHSLGSLFHTISLADRLTLTSAKAFNIKIIPFDQSKQSHSRRMLGAALASNSDSNNDWTYRADDKLYKDNILVRTWELMKERYRLAGEVDIVLAKGIPLGAGLGGGSSDAAALITWVDKVYALRLSMQEKINLALNIGSDVPFFLIGGMAWITGIGADIHSLKVNLVSLTDRNNSDNSNNYGNTTYLPFWIVENDVLVQTKEAYEKFVTYDHYNTYNNLKKMIAKCIHLPQATSTLKLNTDVKDKKFSCRSSVKYSDLKQATQIMNLLKKQATNAFQNKLLAASEVLANIYDHLREGSEYVLLTGSGSAFFCQAAKHNMEALVRVQGVRAIYPIEFTDKAQRFL